MGAFLNIFSFLFVQTCLMGVNLILMVLFGLLRNLPEILKAARQAFQEILVLTYRIYRPIIVRLDPVVQQYFGVKIKNQPTIMLVTALLSVMLLLIFDLALRWRISLLFTVLAILHGATVGFLWNDLDHPSDFRTGEKIE
jgi:hypothetical protein